MSKPKGWDGWGHTDMEQMSTAALEELLRQDFHAPEHEWADTGELYRAARILAEREPGPAAAADQAWEVFEEKYLPFAGDGSSLYEDGSSLYEDGVPPSWDAAPKRRHSLSRRRFCGVLAAVAAVILLSVSAAAAASGYDLWGMLAFWTDEDMQLAPGQIARVEPDKIRIPEEPGSYASIQEALEDYGLPQRLVPQWLPEGFEQSGLVVDYQPGAEVLAFCALYERGGDALVVDVFVYLDRGEEDNGNYGSFQKDVGTPDFYEAGGVTHMVTTNAGWPVAVWANGPAECAVSGDITMEELKEVIDSIYE